MKRLLFQAAKVVPHACKTGLERLKLDAAARRSGQWRDWNSIRKESFWVQKTGRRGHASNVARHGSSSEEIHQLKVFMQSYRGGPNHEKENEWKASKLAKVKVCLGKVLAEQFTSETQGDEATLLFMVANRLEEHALLLEIYHRLKNWGISPSPVALELASLACQRLGNGLMSLNIVQDVVEMEDYIHARTSKKIVFEHAIDACSKEMRWLSCLNLIDDMLNQGVAVSLEGYERAVNACVASNQWTAMWNLHAKQLTAFPHTARSSYQHLLKILTSSNDVRQSWKALQSMVALEKSVEPNTLAVYSDVIRLLAESGYWRHIEAIHSCLANPSSKILPPFEHIAVDKQLALGWQVIQRMQESHLTLTPKMFDAIFAACSQTSHLKKAQEALRLMHELDLQPTVASYREIIECCTKEDYEFAKEIGQTIAAKHLCNVASTQSLFQLANEAQAWEDILSYAKALPETILFSPDVCRFVIKAASRTEKWDAVISYFTQMKRAGLLASSCRNDSTMAKEDSRDMYSHAISAYDRVGQPHVSLMLFQHMLEQDGFMPTQRDCRAAILACVSMKDGKAAFQIYNIMKDHDIAPDSWTGAALFNALTYPSSRKVKELWQELVESIQEPMGVSVLNAALACCANRNDEETALGILKDAANIRMRFNVMTYSVMMRLYASVHKPGKVYEWYHDLLKAGLKPSVYTFNELLAAIQSDDLDSFDRVMRIIEHMHLLEVSFNQQTYIRLFGLCAKYEQWALLEELKKDMFQEIGVPSPRLAVALLKCYSKHPSSEAKLRTLFENHAIGLESEESSEAILKLCCTKFNCSLETALLVFDYLLVNKTASAETFECILSFCAQNQNVEALNRILHLQKQHGHHPSKNLFDSILSMYFHLQRSQDAYDTWQHMKQFRYTPRESILHQLEQLEIFDASSVTNLYTKTSDVAPK